ncbi:MAG: SDR family NAD(P)-dependent oxidoreductase [Rhodospirillaceae bacterium]|nr:SDR family NAD(P)-dependent oxidoreductase [Rhodospirillales bacterium]
MAAEAGGKVAVITGASSGIGRAAAQAFARQNWRLVLAARSLPALEIAAQECTDAGGEAFPFACDVTHFDDIRALAEAAKQRYGQLDVWVNDAGVHMLGRFEDLPLEDFRQVIEVNLMGTVHGCRAALPIFRAQGHGVLINIASMAGAIGQPFASAYVASKWAVRGLSEALRMELLDAPGVHVCTVLPPSIDTPLFQHAGNVAGRAVQPVPPVHSPEELADIIVSLASKPEREVFMGMGRLVAAARAVAPAATERLMARAVAKRHFQQSTSGRSRGNLYAPQTDSGRATAITIAAAALVAVPLGVYAWRRMRGHSAYV